MKRSTPVHSVSGTRRRRLTALILLLGAFIFPSSHAAVCQAAAAQPSLSLSPAVIRADGTFGQSMTQTLKINNQTSSTFQFEMIAQDVALRDNKRTFFSAGELPNSIAASAVFSQREITVAPFGTGSVDVTLTIPEKTEIRAVVAIFRGKLNQQPGSSSVGLVASLGTLITFHLTADKSLKADPLQVELPTQSTNLTIGAPLENSGTEPLSPEGVAAILNSSGKIVGKARFNSLRLLPGEKQTLRAEYPDPLPPGQYQALCTFEFDGKSDSSSISFVIK